MAPYTAVISVLLIQWLREVRSGRHCFTSISDSNQDGSFAVCVEASKESLPAPVFLVTFVASGAVVGRPGSYLETITVPIMKILKISNHREGQVVTHLHTKEFAMRRSQKLKTAIAGLAAAGALVLGATAQAVTLDAGIFGSNLGDLGTASNPVVINVNNPPSGLFLDTINFDLGSWTHFNMTSTAPNINFFGAPIFENVNDTEVVPASPTHASVALANLGLPRDYHLHPQGQNSGGGTYQLKLWGSANAPVPIPAAAWLFGSGVIGLAGLARRKMAASA